MFKRKQTQQFEITEHPDVVAALNAMAEDWYQRGRRDALAIAVDLLEEVRAGRAEGPDYANGIIGVIARLDV